MANSVVHSRSTQDPVWKMIFALVLVCASRAPSHAQTFKVIHDFGVSSDGAAPFATVTGDISGNLYGVTWKGPFEHGCFFDGCGTVFKLSPNADGTWTEAILYEFTGGNDGFEPASPVAVDSTGNIYGVTQALGQEPGTVFEIVRSSDGSYMQRTLHTFDDTNGGLSPFEITLDRRGRLFGTTDFGGVFNRGVVFRLDRISILTWSEKVLRNFNDPWGAAGKLLLDDEGNIYGTTNQGGASGKGTVIKLTPGTDPHRWTLTVLYTFTGSPDGALPSSGLTADGQGNFYGTTDQGGSAGCGTVFELSPTSDGGWHETILYSFQNGRDGCFPPSGVSFDSAGNLYGTMTSGGPAGLGLVYKLTHLPSGEWSKSVLHTFSGADGKYPYSIGNVFVDANNNVYGTALLGGTGMTCSQPGQGCGVVWEITP